MGSALMAAIALPVGLVLWLRTPAAPPEGPPPVVSAQRGAPVVEAPAPDVESPARRPTAPTVEVPCVSFRADDQADDIELVTTGTDLVVCWHNGACRVLSGDLESYEVDPPAARSATTVATRVEPERVCTEARCDALGPRLRAAIKGADPVELRATVGHALVVIESADEPEIWSRVRDRRLAVPKPHDRGWDAEGHVLAVDLLGDHVLVSRSWNADVSPPPPWAPASGTILDAQGTPTGTIATAASSHVRGTSILDLGDDQFVVFNGAGGFSVIVHGKPRWFGDLVEWRAVEASRGHSADPALGVLEGQAVPIQAIALDAEPEADDVAIDGTLLGKERLKTIGYKWCRSWTGCQVGRIQIGFNVALGGKETQWLRRVDHHVFPTCQ